MKESAEKTAKETAERLAKEAAEKTAKEASENTAKSGAKKGGGKGKGGKVKKMGKGQYRGGSYGGTTSEGIQSHHMPADSISPIPRSQGPAIQMSPTYHAKTDSHGHQGTAGAKYRKQIESLLNQNKWRDAVATEIKNARKVARQSGDQTKYNEAIKEILAYFHCLEKFGLLP